MSGLPHCLCDETATAVQPCKFEQESVRHQVSRENVADFIGVDTPSTVKYGCTATCAHRTRLKTESSASVDRK